MNNKPYAWYYFGEIWFPSSEKEMMEWVAMNKWEYADEPIPLYTHPHSEESVKVKELTDEEIEEFAYAFQLWQLHNPDKALEGIMDFARAILRKAQEK